MTEEKSWFYYNRAMFCNCAPHDDVDIQRIESGDIWKNEGKHAILARYTSDFDCGYETEWWYMIKDDLFDISALKSNRRHKITRGRKRFYLERINPADYVEELFRVQSAAYSSYPKKYRPHSTKADFLKMTGEWVNDDKTYVLGCFFRESGKLCGYAVVRDEESYLNYTILKVDPAYERHYINFALMADVLDYFSEQLGGRYYINNGERNIQHETNFQEILENYFGYRKAYCHLNIRYNPKYKPIIKTLYLFRGIFKLFDRIRVVHKINGVLKMEKLIRLQKKEKTHE